MKKFRKKKLKPPILILLNNNGYTNNELKVIFGIPINKRINSWFEDPYNNITLGHYDIICSLLPNENPRDILKLLTFTSKFLGYLNRLYRNPISKKDKLDKVEKKKVNIDIKAATYIKLLNDIIYAESFEDRQIAIGNAELQISILKHKINEV